jgi:hypothetical protein
MTSKRKTETLTQVPLALKSCSALAGDASALQPVIQASAGQPSVSLPPSAMEAGPLAPQDLFNLADLLLDLAGRLLVGAFVFQIWIIGSFSQLLLDLAFHFVKLAFRLVFGT